MRARVRLLVPLTALGLGLSALPAVAGGSGLPDAASDRARQATGQASTAEAVAGPFDYVAQAPQLSQPEYDALVRDVIKMEAHDGKLLHVEVVKPDPAVHGDGPWPVVLEASPYHGTIADRDGTRIFPDPTDAEGNKIGLTGYFAKRGYAVAMMDLRGTGQSQGCLDHLGQNDAKDLVTVIEALADAPWSNGRIGMTGHSYVGSTPSVAAAHKPRGLVTIVPSAGLASMYDHQFNKGVPWLLQYVGPMVAYEALALNRDLPSGTPVEKVPVAGAPGGDNFDNNGPNPETGCGLASSAALAGTGQATGQYELWHAERDHRAGAADADIPVFMVHGANDNAARITAAEWHFNGRFSRPGDKTWIGQWDHGSTNGRCGAVDGSRTLHPTCRFEQFQYALHAWFDKHLMQRDVQTGPAVEAFLNAEEAVDITKVIDPETVDSKVYTADAWTRPTSHLGLFPDATTGKLGFVPPAESGSTTFDGGVQAVLASARSGKAVFTSDPLAEDTVLLGLPQLNLTASQSGSQVNHLTASLYRVDADGNRELMNVCGIQPMLRHGVHDLAPVVPGQAMDLPMQCFTAAQWVKAGQTLVLEIATRTQHHASFASDPRITVFTGPKATRYLLPKVDGPLHDDVPLRDGGQPDGDVAPGVGAAQESGAAAAGHVVSAERAATLPAAQRRVLLEQ